MKTGDKIGSMHVSTLDPADLRLLHALQIDPRASFSDIAAALRTDPATVSRRWSRLREGGYVWITGVSGTRGLDVFALIDVDCEPSRLTAVADRVFDPGETVVLQLQDPTDARPDPVAATTGRIRDVRPRPAGMRGFGRLR